MLAPVGVCLNEYGRQSLLACPAKWIILRETLVEIGVRKISAVQKQPFDVDELAVAAHANTDLPFQIELVL
jgi:hypothetical protein